MAEITETDLREKHQRRVETNRADAAQTSRRIKVDGLIFRDVEAECSECHKEFVFESPFTGAEKIVHPDNTEEIVSVGRQFLKREVCGECASKAEAARQADERRLEAAQTKHVSMLSGQEREYAIRAVIEKAGANAHEHGHASFHLWDSAERGSKALDAGRDFAQRVLTAARYDAVRGLYLHGDTGTDKTFLAIAVVRYLIENGWKPEHIVFDNAAELILRIQDTYGRKDASTMAVIEKRINARLWICDDFGTEKYSEDVIRNLTVLFAQRAMKPNLITSNNSPKFLETNRKDLFRIVSRLGPKYFKVVSVSGHDRRFDPVDEQE